MDEKGGCYPLRKLRVITYEVVKKQGCSMSTAISLARFETRVLQNYGLRSSRGLTTVERRRTRVALVKNRKNYILSTEELNHCSC